MQHKCNLADRPRCVFDSPRCGRPHSPSEVAAPWRPLMPQLVHIFVSAQIFGFAQMRFIHDVTPARVFAALQLQIRLAPPDPRGGCRRLHQALRQRDEESDQNLLERRGQVRGDRGGGWEGGWRGGRREGLVCSALSAVRPNRHSTHSALDLISTWSPVQ